MAWQTQKIKSITKILTDPTVPSRAPTHFIKCPVQLWDNTEIPEVHQEKKKFLLIETKNPGFFPTNATVVCAGSQWFRTWIVGEEVWFMVPQFNPPRAQEIDFTFNPYNQRQITIADTLTQVELQYASGGSIQFEPLDPLPDLTTRGVLENPYFESTRPPPLTWFCMDDAWYPLPSLPNLLAFLSSSAFSPDPKNFRLPNPFDSTWSLISFKD